MSVTLIPIPERNVTFTPLQDPSGDGPFARVKRDFHDFQNLKDTYATFAALKAAYPGS